MLSYDEQARKDWMMDHKSKVPTAIGDLICAVMLDIAYIIVTITRYVIAFGIWLGPK